MRKVAQLRHCRLPLAAPLVALVVDAHSNPVQGAVVTFSDGGKGGSFTSTGVTTDASGHAATSYTTPNTAGVVKITATTGSLKAASFSVTVTQNKSVPYMCSPTKRAVPLA